MVPFSGTARSLSGLQPEAAKRIHYGVLIIQKPMEESSRGSNF